MWRVESKKSSLLFSKLIFWNIVNPSNNFEFLKQVGTNCRNYRAFLIEYRLVENDLRNTLNLNVLKKNGIFFRIFVLGKNECRFHNSGILERVGIRGLSRKFIFD